MDPLREVVAQGDTLSLEQAAHSLKSSTSNVGAVTLAMLCRELESMGQANDLANTHTLLKQVETEYEQVRKALATMVTREN